MEKLFWLNNNMSKKKNANNEVDVFKQYDDLFDKQENDSCSETKKDAKSEGPR